MYTERMNALHCVIKFLKKKGRDTHVEEDKYRKLEKQRALYALKHNL